MLQRISNIAATPRFILWGTAVVAAVVFLGIPIRYRVPPTWIYLDQGNAYYTPVRLLWPLVIVSDDLQALTASDTKLTEDGRPLGPAHTGHVSIREVGDGRYSHWRGALYFSTSDNSDPRSNGRRYVASVRLRLAPEILLAVFLGFGAAAARLALRWLRSGLVVRSDVLRPAILWLGVGLGLRSSYQAEGIAFWLLVGLAAVLLVWATASTRRTFSKGTSRTWKGYGQAANATLFAVSLSLTLAASEACLMAWEGRLETSNPVNVPAERALESFGVELPPELLRSVARRSALLTLPSEFQHESLTVEGAAYAYTWQGELHLHDENEMRRATPFPPRRPDAFRVMVVGDSFTYGIGIDEQWTYPRQLERLLEPDYEVEVLNLGVSGLQSEDVLRKVQEFLPILRPDLVVYGVCHNDFLPSGAQEDAKDASPNSRLVRLASDAYRQVLLGIGLQHDFYGDILDGFKGHQERFGRDVVSFNELVKASGLPSAITLVLDHRPDIDPRGHQLTRATESWLEAASMDVIEMAPYYRHFGGHDFRVSRWEGHPNEIANAIWAEMLNRHVRTLPVLRRFHKSSAEPVAPRRETTESR